MLVSALRSIPPQPGSKECSVQTSAYRSRHMKGKQIPITVYLEPKRYWLLKWLSNHKGLSMQALIRSVIDQVLEEAGRAR
jgi:hypothetical protein